jgi:hypothetical protein
MDLIVAAAEADAEFASELERAIGRAGLFGAVDTERVADEDALAALIHAESKKREVLVAVVVSRKFATVIRSLVQFDELLGTRIDGRLACIGIVRSGADQPSDDVGSICARHLAIEAASTIEDVALRLVGRAARAQDESPRAPTAARVNLAMRKVRRSMDVLRLALIVVAVVVVLVVKCSKR